MYTKHFVLMKHWHDYESGFSDLESCQAVCNDLWNGNDGCLAIDWHETDKHCVVYNGTGLTVEQWKSALEKKESYSVCMLVPDALFTNDDATSAQETFGRTRFDMHYTSVVV